MVICFCRSLVTALVLLATLISQGQCYTVTRDSSFTLKSPPRGWRSWNQMGPNINQSQMLAIAEAMVDRSRKVDGKPTSLLDLGFNRIGMDDNWQACGTGINGSFHSASGEPLWNKTRFPNVKAMNAKIHDLGLYTDWYINNCICPEKGDVSTPPRRILCFHPLWPNIL